MGRKIVNGDRRYKHRPAGSVFKNLCGQVFSNSQSVVDENRGRREGQAFRIGRDHPSVEVKLTRSFDVNSRPGNDLVLPEAWQPA